MQRSQSCELRQLLYSNRQTLIKCVALLIGISFTLIISEILLVVYSGYISRDQMDPGLITLNRSLGWSLAPNWRGEHEHHDYQVEYSINFKGERNPSISDEPRKFLLLGDSFTFGLGVNDDETFAALLQAQSDMGVVNGGVPGYSPEQSVLRGISLATRYKPEVIGLVVYLGNDLLDIGHEFSIQAPGSKPYIVLNAEGRGQFKNLPVVDRIRPVKFADLSLADRILKNPSEIVLGRSQLYRLLFNEFGVDAELDLERADHSVRLFSELLNYLVVNTEAELQIIILPGSGALSSTRGTTVRYQNLIREHLLLELKRLELSSIDLMPFLLAREHDDLYHPNDGHLTKKGHRVVAEMLLREVAALKN